MTKEEAEKAILENSMVALPRPGRPDQPYLGHLTSGPYGLIFKGRSGSEEIVRKVEPEDISSVERRQCGKRQTRR